MSERSYEISFRAVLDDRQVDELADTLFELGYDDLAFRPLEPPASSAVPEWAAKGAETVRSGPPLAPVRTCGVCGKPRYQKHAETCAGRAS